MENEKHIHDGELIRRLMEQKNVTQKELAEVLKKDRRTVSRLLTQKEWTARDLGHAGKHLGVDLIARWQPDHPNIKGTIKLPGGEVKPVEGRLRILGLPLPLEDYIEPVA